MTTEWRSLSFSQLAQSAKVVGVQAELESMLEIVARELGEELPAAGSAIAQ